MNILPPKSERDARDHREESRLAQVKYDEKCKNAPYSNDGPRCDPSETKRKVERETMNTKE
jgi:hypothetical protein